MEKLRVTAKHTRISLEYDCDDASNKFHPIRKLVKKEKELEVEATIYLYDDYFQIVILNKDELNISNKQDIIFHKKRYSYETNRFIPEFRIVRKVLNKIYLDRKEYFDSFGYYSKRLNTRIKLFAKLANFENLDPQDQFVKIFFAKRNYKKYLRSIRNEKFYKNMRQHAEKDEVARGLIISFFAKHWRFEELIKDKKWSWVLDNTPRFWLKHIVAEKGLRNDFRFKIYPYFKEQKTEEWLKVFKYQQKGFINTCCIPTDILLKYQHCLMFKPEYILLRNYLMASEWKNSVLDAFKTQPRLLSDFRSRLYKEFSILEKEYESGNYFRFKSLLENYLYLCKKLEIDPFKQIKMKEIYLKMKLSDDGMRL